MNNLKKNLIWNIIGSITASIISLLFTIILTRFSNIDNAGIYTIAFALACNTTIVAAFGGRIYQVTDTKGDIHTFSYILSRYITILLTIFIIIIYLLFKDYSLYKSLIILIICLYKYLDELSDVYYGVMQKNDLLYKVGKFQFFKSLINTLIFLLLILGTNNLILSFLVLLLVNLIFIYFERKNAKKIENWKHLIDKVGLKKYFKSNLFICLLGFLTTYIINCPKYAIDSFSTSTVQVIFGIIVMPTTAMLLLNNFILNPFIVSIAKNYNNKNIDAIKDLIKKIFKVVFLIGIIILTVCYFIGIPVLNLIYNLDLNNYKLSLMIIIIGSVFYTIGAMISTILVTMRVIKKQILVNIFVIIVSLFICNNLVKEYNVLGASLVFSLLIFIRFILLINILRTSLKTHNNINGRVLHVLSSNSFSGAENVACTIIENNDLYESFYCSPYGPIKDVLSEKDINYIPLKSLNPFEIKKICNKYNINIIHAHDYKASFISAISFNGKIISHLHGNNDFISSWNIYTIMYNMIINRFYKIIVVSKSILDEGIFVKNHRNKFVLLPNIVDKKMILKKSKEHTSKKYDLIYIGRLEKVKHPELVIEIIKEIVKKMPKIKVCMIGSGSLSNICNDLIKKYNLSNNIDMLGFVSNPFPYIRNSKIGLLTSLHEGIPMSTIECMVLDVPVLNSGVDGLNILFKNNKKFICNNIMEYCTKIEDILNGNNTYKSDCKKIVNDYVDINNYIKKINKIYMKYI